MYAGLEGVQAQADPTAPSQVMTDVAGNPEEERRAEFYHQPWSQEAVSRYFYCKVWRGSCTSGPHLSVRERPWPSPGGSPPCSQMLFRVRQGEGQVVGVVLSLASNTNPAPALTSLKIQQRRQELEQSLVVRNT